MMIKVDGGAFRMGSYSGFADERPVHTVSVDSFMLDSHPLTQVEWYAIMGNNPSYFSSNPYEKEDQDRRPVESVNVYDVFKYCNLRSIKEGLEPVYSLSGKTNPSLWPDVPDEQNVLWDTVLCNWSANGYRLPTEAEWEFAARGGRDAEFADLESAEKESQPSKTDSEKHFFSEATIEQTSWTSSNSHGKTHQVGLKKPNSLGFYDMCGNVWEWCWDWYSCYPSETVENPHGTEKHTRTSDRLGRGGGWNSVITDCTPFYRNTGSPGDRFNFLGVRLARTCE